MRQVQADRTRGWVGISLDENEQWAYWQARGRSLVQGMNENERKNEESTRLLFMT